MPHNTIDASQRNIVRLAGLMFIFSFLVPSLNWLFVLSKFIVAENVLYTANNILANEFLFGIGIISDLITSAIVVALAMVLYTILKSVNKNLALLALFFKLTEATLWAVIALSYYIALQILNGQAHLTPFTPEQIQAVVGLFLNVRISVSAIPMVFLGLNLMLFLYILFKSKYVPRILSGFGIISYALVLIHALINILSPNYGTSILVQAICWAPSVIFELTIGFWLLFKGIKVPETRS